MTTWHGSPALHKATYKGYALTVRKGTNCYFATVQHKDGKYRHKAKSARLARVWCEHEAEHMAAFESFMNLSVPF